MRKHRQLYGLMMYPCSFTQEDHESTIFSSKYASKSNFKGQYEEYMAAMKILAESAKIYVLNNWEKITDWGGFDISIIDNSKEETYYYNYTDRYVFNEGVGSQIMRKFHERRKEYHNPIKEIKDVVLDTSDGDFSLTINGKEHNWIDDESVIVLADFIETKLKNKETKK